MKVWMNGQITDPEEAKLNVLDHGLLYGDGVFEGMRAHSGHVFRLEDHLDRLTYGAKAIYLPLPIGREGLRRLVADTVAAAEGDALYIRLIVTRGVGPLGVDPAKCEDGKVICIAGQIQIFSEEQRARGVSMATVSVRRPPADVLDPRVKSLNYLNSVMAKAEAHQRGAQEALVLNQAGNIAEASVANVFVVRDGELFTPPTTDGALDGMTRRTVMELAVLQGRQCHERSLGRVDMLRADEVFLTGTGAGIVRVSSLDGQPVGRPEPGPITTALVHDYEVRLRSGA